MHSLRFNVNQWVHEVERVHENNILQTRHICDHEIQIKIIFFNYWPLIPVFISTAQHIGYFVQGNYEFEHFHQIDD